MPAGGGIDGDDDRRVLCARGRAREQHEENDEVQSVAPHG
jgi:hypothetical protein